MDYEIEQHQESSPRNEDAEGPTRILHAMYRVFNLQRSLDFYIGALGMRLLRRQDYPTGRFTLAFVGYAEESDTTVLELTHNWDQAEPYTPGTGYGHIALAVNDIYRTCELLAAQGVGITRLPGPMRHSPTLIAFIEDPDGYKIELIERR